MLKACQLNTDCYPLKSMFFTARLEKSNQHVRAILLLCSVDDDQEKPLPTDDDDMSILDLGQCNELGRPVSARIKVINTTAIQTTLHLEVSNFPPAPNVHKPPHQGIFALHISQYETVTSVLLFVAVSNPKI